MFGCVGREIVGVLHDDMMTGALSAMGVLKRYYQMVHQIRRVLR